MHLQRIVPNFILNAYIHADRPSSVISCPTFRIQLSVCSSLFLHVRRNLIFNGICNTLCDALISLHRQNVLLTRPRSRVCPRGNMRSNASIAIRLAATIFVIITLHLVWRGGGLAAQEKRSQHRNGSSNNHDSILHSVGHDYQRDAWGERWRITYVHQIRKSFVLSIFESDLVIFVRERREAYKWSRFCRRFLLWELFLQSRQSWRSCLCQVKSIIRFSIFSLSAVARRWKQAWL